MVRVVCHFYRGATWRCQIIDRHLDRVAEVRAAFEAMDETTY